MTCVKLIFVHP